MKYKKKGKVSQRNKEMMMVLVVRHPDVFAVARTVLRPEHFGVSDVGFAIAWRVLLDFWEKFESLPSRELMFAEVDKWLGEHPQELTQEEIEELNSWLDVAYDDQHWGEQVSDETYVRWGVETLKRFLSEQLAQEISEETVAGSRVVASLPELMSGYQQSIEQIESLDLPEEQELFYPGWDCQEGFDLVPTRVRFVDDYLVGGDRAGEAYGLMGPYGSCKTTLSFMLACERSRAGDVVRKRPDWDGKHRLAVLVCYETPKIEARHRLLMYLAKVHRQSLERMGKYGLASLSTSKKGNYRNYEKIIFADAFKEGKGGLVLGEQERIAHAAQLLNNHLLVLDMTGFDETIKHAGMGYIPEIARRIKWEIRRRNNPNIEISGIYIDYVTLMARRHLRTLEGKDESYMRHLVGGAPDEAKRLLGLPFRCPVWLVSQLNKEGNSRSATGLIDYTHSAEASNFAENLDFCFCVGRITQRKNDSVCVFHSRKHRRTGNMRPQVIRMYGTLHRLALATNMTIRNNKIIYTKDLKEVESGDVSTPNTSGGGYSGKKAWAVGT